MEDQFRDGDNVAFLCDVIAPEAQAGDWQRVLDLLREREAQRTITPNVQLSEEWRAIGICAPSQGGLKISCRP